MKKINLFKSLSLVAVALFFGACSNEDVVNNNEETDVEGIPFSVNIDGGTSDITSSNVVSRLGIGTTKEAEMGDKLTWKWEVGDSIYVIADNGSYLGSLVTKQAGERVEFKTNAIKVQDGMKLHFWFFGRTVDKSKLKGEAASDAAKYGKRNASAILNRGTALIDLTHQYHDEPLGAKEVMCCNAVVKVENGVATIPDCTMRHITSCAIADLAHLNTHGDEYEGDMRYEYEIINLWYGACKKIEIENVLKTATIDLVSEKIVSSTKGTETVWIDGEDGDTPFNVGWFNWTIIPGENNPVIYYQDPWDRIFTASQTNWEVPEGHFIGETYNGGDIVRLPFDRHLAPMDKQKFVIPHLFYGRTQDRYFCFAKGNLYATNVGGENGTKLEIASNQGYTKDSDPWAKYSGTSKRNYEFSWLDSKIGSSSTDWGDVDYTYGLYTTTDQAQKDAAYKSDYQFDYDYELNPGLLYKKQHSDVAGCYTLPSENDLKSVFGWGSGTYYHAVARVDIGGGKMVTGLVCTAAQSSKFTKEEMGAILGTAQYDKLSMFADTFKEENIITDITMDDINNAWAAFIPIQESAPSYVGGLVRYEDEGTYWLCNNAGGLRQWPRAVSLGFTNYEYQWYVPTSTFNIRLVTTIDKYNK